MAEFKQELSYTFSRVKNGLAELQRWWPATIINDGDLALSVNPVLFATNFGPNTVDSDGQVVTESNQPGIRVEAINDDGSTVSGDPTIEISGSGGFAPKAVVTWSGGTKTAIYLIAPSAEGKTGIEWSDEDYDTDDGKNMNAPCTDGGAAQTARTPGGALPDTTGWSTPSTSGLIPNRGPTSTTGPFPVFMTIQEFVEWLDTYRHLNGSWVDTDKPSFLPHGLIGTSSMVASAANPNPGADPRTTTALMGFTQLQQPALSKIRATVFMPMLLDVNQYHKDMTGAKNDVATFYSGFHTRLLRPMAQSWVTVLNDSISYKTGGYTYRGITRYDPHPTTGTAGVVYKVFGKSGDHLLGAHGSFAYHKEYTYGGAWWKNKEVSAHTRIVPSATPAATWTKVLTNDFSAYQANPDISPDSTATQGPKYRMKMALACFLKDGTYTLKDGGTLIPYTYDPSRYLGGQTTNTLYATWDGDRGVGSLMDGTALAGHTYQTECSAQVYPMFDFVQGPLNPSNMGQNFHLDVASGCHLSWDTLKKMPNYHTSGSATIPGFGRGTPSVRELFSYMTTSNGWYCTLPSGMASFLYSLENAGSEDGFRQSISQSFALPEQVETDDATFNPQFNPADGHQPRQWLVRPNPKKAKILAIKKNKRGLSSADNTPATMSGGTLTLWIEHDPATTIDRHNQGVSFGPNCAVYISNLDGELGTHAPDVLAQWGTHWPSRIQGMEWEIEAGDAGALQGDTAAYSTPAYRRRDYNGWWIISHVDTNDIFDDSDRYTKLTATTADMNTIVTGSTTGSKTFIKIQIGIGPGTKLINAHLDPDGKGIAWGRGAADGSTGWGALQTVARTTTWGGDSNAGASTAVYGYKWPVTTAITLDPLNYPLTSGLAIGGLDETYSGEYNQEVAAYEPTDAYICQGRLGGAGGGQFQVPSSQMYETTTWPWKGHWNTIDYDSNIRGTNAGSIGSADRGGTGRFWGSSPGGQMTAAHSNGSKQMGELSWSFRLLDTYTYKPNMLIFLPYDGMMGTCQHAGIFSSDSNTPIAGSHQSTYPGRICIDDPSQDHAVSARTIVSDKRFGIQSGSDSSIAVAPPFSTKGGAVLRLAAPLSWDLADRYYATPQITSSRGDLTGLNMANLRYGGILGYDSAPSSAAEITKYFSRSTNSNARSSKQSIPTIYAEVVCEGFVGTYVDTTKSDPDSNPATSANWDTATDRVLYYAIPAETNDGQHTVQEQDGDAASIGQASSIVYPNMLHRDIYDRWGHRGVSTPLWSFVEQDTGAHAWDHIRPSTDGGTTKWPFGRNRPWPGHERMGTRLGYGVSLMADDISAWPTLAASGNYVAGQTETTLYGMSEMACSPIWLDIELHGYFPNQDNRKMVIDFDGGEADMFYGRHHMSYGAPNRQAGFGFIPMFNGGQAKAVSISGTKMSDISAVFTSGTQVASSDTYNDILVGFIKGSATPPVFDPIIGGAPGGTLSPGGPRGFYIQERADVNDATTPMPDGATHAEEYYRDTTGIRVSGEQLFACPLGGTGAAYTRNRPAIYMGGGQSHFTQYTWENANPVAIGQGGFGNMGGGGGFGPSFGYTEGVHTIRAAFTEVGMHMLLDGTLVGTDTTVSKPVWGFSIKACNLMTFPTRSQGWFVSSRELVPDSLAPKNSNGRYNSLSNPCKNVTPIDLQLDTMTLRHIPTKAMLPFEVDTIKILPASDIARYTSLVVTADDVSLYNDMNVTCSIMEPPTITTIAPEATTAVAGFEDMDMAFAGGIGSVDLTDLPDSLKTTGFCVRFQFHIPDCRSDKHPIDWDKIPKIRKWSVFYDKKPTVELAVIGNTYDGTTASTVGQTTIQSVTSKVGHIISFRVFGDTPDPDRKIAYVKIDYGDGVVSSKLPVTTQATSITYDIAHVYSDRPVAGYYDVKAYSYDDSDNISDVLTPLIRVNLALAEPTAILRSVPAVTRAGQGVVLDASESYSTDTVATLASFTYTPGDGSAATTITTNNLTHTYATAGEYMATMTTTDSLGSVSGVTKALVKVLPATLIVPLTLNTMPSSFTRNRSATFTQSAVLDAVYPELNDSGQRQDEFSMKGMFLKSTANQDIAFMEELLHSGSLVEFEWEAVNYDGVATNKTFVGRILDFNYQREGGQTGQTPWAATLVREAGLT